MVVAGHIRHGLGLDAFLRRSVLELGKEVGLDIRRAGGPLDSAVLVVVVMADVALGVGVDTVRLEDVVELILEGLQLVHLILEALFLLFKAFHFLELELPNVRKHW